MGQNKNLIYLLCLVPMLTVVGRKLDFKNNYNNNNNNNNNENENENENKYLDNNNNKSINWISIENRIKREIRSSNDIHLNDNEGEVEVKIFGMSFKYKSDKKKVEYENDDTPLIVEGLEVIMQLYGMFLNTTEIRYTNNGHECEDNYEHVSQIYNLKMLGDENNKNIYISSSVEFVLPLKEIYPEIYFCLRKNSTTPWKSPGKDKWLHVKIFSKLLPIWLHVTLIISLLLLSGLFSGLNLGLMSLNKTDLKIITNTGTPAEREYASTIAPVRNHGNFLLCCLLFSNVLVNASLTILVDELTSGFIAIVMSTLSIVIFGEIIPQAICSRHGLAVGAKTIYITKFFMAITFPLSYPLSKILDKCLGEEIGSVYTRERLKELLKVTKDHHGLENEEVGIISGALDMKTKTVRDIMTSLESVFMISIDSNLDFETLAEIDFQGYSRIPVYETERGNVVAVLNVKQLTLLDGSDSIPIRQVVEYYKSSLFYVFENTRLDYMFRAFREGNRGHMAFVQKVNDEGPGDPYYETVGVVTMEDVLEELLQAEIMDETDVGKYQARLARKERPREIPFTAHRKYKPVVEVQPQLALAAVQYLATNVDAFDRECVSESIVQRLLTTSVCTDKPLKLKAHEVIKNKFLFKAGEPADYFIMILEGKVEVQVGAEPLMFEAGPFHHFGANFLSTEFKNDSSHFCISEANQIPVTIKKHIFIPDYSVRIISEVFYIRLKYSLYVAARQATDMERNHKDPERTGEKDWENEIEKVLNAADEGMPAHKRVHMAPNAEPVTPVNGAKQLKVDQVDAKLSENRRRKSEPGDKSETKHLL